MKVLSMWCILPRNWCRTRPAPSPTGSAHASPGARPGNQHKNTAGASGPQRIGDHRIKLAGLDPEQPRGFLGIDQQRIFEQIEHLYRLLEADAGQLLRREA